MIQNDEHLKSAQQSVANLQAVLVEARKVHTPEEYRLLSGPILLELQQREHEILVYLSETTIEAAAA